FWKSKQLSQEEISLTEEQPESEPVNNQGSEHEGDTSLGKSTTPLSTKKPNESNFYIKLLQDQGSEHSEETLHTLYMNFLACCHQTNRTTSLEEEPADCYTDFYFKLLKH
ncbi:hypothetical protein XENORESO_017355, partial [Xenotaenia resolanae]